MCTQLQQHVHIRPVSKPEDDLISVTSAFVTLPRWSIEYKDAMDGTWKDSQTPQASE